MKKQALLNTCLICLLILIQPRNSRAQIRHIIVDTPVLAHPHTPVAVSQVFVPAPPAHPRPVLYTRSGNGFAEIKKTFATTLPLSIQGIDVSRWQISQNPVIIVYYIIKNQTLQTISGYVEPAIGDLPYTQYSSAVNNLPPNGSFSGSIAIANPPVICYDNILQITFFRFDTVGRSYQNPRNQGLGQRPQLTYSIQSSQQSADVSHLNVSTITRDDDHDFLDDGLERFLLERFRPYFKFSLQDGPEQYRPCDVFNYIRNSTLGGNHQSALGKTDNCPPLAGFNQAFLSGSPDSLLTRQLPNSLLVDLWGDPERSLLHLQPNDIAKHGSDWNEVMANKNIGLYGHVIPVVLTNPSLYQRGQIFACGNGPQQLYYKVEYWQFFGYNYAHQHIGGRDYADHEGDWASVQLLIEPATLRIVSVFHYAHGTETRFDIDPAMISIPYKDNSRLSMIQYNGRNAAQPSNADINDGGTGQATKDNRYVRFYQDNGETGFNHVMVYIENGSHEFWPTDNNVYGSTQVGTRYYAPSHYGDDYAHSYLTATPPNLGEMEHPLKETIQANVILRYSGLWGCYNVYNSNPPGPTLHTEWTYPFDSAIYKSIAYALEN